MRDEKNRNRGGGIRMLLLIVALVFGVLAFGRRVRLEGATEVRACAEERKPDVRAYVDGKLVKSYLKE